MRFGQLLGRVRPPRVQITYDVETAGALEKKELPFILGIISPLSGKSLKAPTPMAEKSWIFIDRENFNQVLESIAPRIAFSVPNTLANDSGELSVSVSFYNIDDFDPVAVIKHVPPLNCLFQGRRRLRDFMAKLDGNPALNSLVLSILVDKARRDGLKTIITEVQAKLDITPELTGLDARDKAILEAFRAKLAKDERSDINALLADGQIIEAEAQNSYRLELAEFISLLLQEDCKWVSIFEELDALAALLKTQKAEECVAISTLETKAALLKARQAIKDTEKKQEILIGHINISNEISRYIDKRDTIILSLIHI